MDFDMKNMNKGLLFILLAMWNIYSYAAHKELMVEQTTSYAHKAAPILNFLKECQYNFYEQCPTICKEKLASINLAFTAKEIITSQGIYYYDEENKQAHFYSLIHNKLVAIPYKTRSHIAPINSDYLWNKKTQSITNITTQETFAITLPSYISIDQIHANSTNTHWALVCSQLVGPSKRKYTLYLYDVAAQKCLEQTYHLQYADSINACPRLIGWSSHPHTLYAAINSDESAHIAHIDIFDKKIITVAQYMCPSPIQNFTVSPDGTTCIIEGYQLKRVDRTSDYDKNIQPTCWIGRLSATQKVLWNTTDIDSLWHSNIWGINEFSWISDKELVQVRAKDGTCSHVIRFKIGSTIDTVVEKTVREIRHKNLRLDRILQENNYKISTVSIHPAGTYIMLNFLKNDIHISNLLTWNGTSYEFTHSHSNNVPMPFENCHTAQFSKDGQYVHFIDNSFHKICVKLTDIYKYLNWIDSKITPELSQLIAEKNNYYQPHLKDYCIEQLFPGRDRIQRPITYSIELQDKRIYTFNAAELEKLFKYSEYFKKVIEDTNFKSSQFNYLIKNTDFTYENVSSFMQLIPCSFLINVPYYWLQYPIEHNPLIEEIKNNDFKLLPNFLKLSHFLLIDSKVCDEQIWSTIKATINKIWAPEETSLIAKISRITSLDIRKFELHLTPERTTNVTNTVYDFTVKVLHLLKLSPHHIYDLHLHKVIKHLEKFCKSKAIFILSVDCFNIIAHAYLLIKFIESLDFGENVLEAVHLEPLYILWPELTAHEDLPEALKIRYDTFANTVQEMEDNCKMFCPECNTSRITADVNKYATKPSNQNQPKVADILKLHNNYHYSKNLETTELSIDQVSQEKLTVESPLSTKTRLSGYIKTLAILGTTLTIGTYLSCYIIYMLKPYIKLNPNTL